MTPTLDPAKAHVVRKVPQPGVGFWCGALDPAAKRLYAGGTDSHIHVYDLPAVQPSTPALLKGHRSYVTALVHVPGTRTLVSGSFAREVHWWRPAESDEPTRRLLTNSRVNRLAVSADGKLVAAALDDDARIWHARTGDRLAVLKGGHPPTTRIGRRNALYAVALSADGKRAATGDRAGTVCLWETASGKLLHKASASAFYSQALYRDTQNSEYEWGGVKALAFSPDGTLLAAGGMGPADQNSAGIDGPMRLETFDAATGKGRAAFMSAPKGMLTSLAFHSAGDWLIAGGGGGQAGGAGIGSLWLWNPRRLGKDHKPVPPVTHASEIVIREVVLVPDSTTLLALGMLRDLTAGRIDVWDLGKGNDHFVSPDIYHTSNMAIEGSP